jgi:hypothetical protein
VKVQSSKKGRWEKAGRLGDYEVWRMRIRERLKLALWKGLIKKFDYECVI